MKRILILIIVFTLLVGCNEEDPPIENEVIIEEVEDSGGTYMQARGFSLSPYSFDESGLNDFMDKMETFDVLRWGGKIEEFKDGAPYAMAQWQKDYGWDILLATDLYEGDRPIDYDQSIDHMIDYIEEYHPKYISLGVEVNSKLNDDSEKIKEYAEEFNDIKALIKQVSPDTEVLVVFQYEWLLGLRNGLFGGEKADPTWEYLEWFEADIIGFTTYPCLFYQDPWSIPRDYYGQIKDHTDLPIAFTEIGWYTSDEIKDWESSDDEQKRFAERFLVLTDKLDPVISVWSFMYEIFDSVPFKTMAFFDSDLSEKSGFEVWESGNVESVEIKPVYFVSRLDHEAGEIYRLSSDGFIERLTFNERHENNVALSHDGQKLAYHGGSEKDLLSYEIFVLDLNTGIERQLTNNNLLDGHPDWYPDGNLIYASFDDGNGNPNATADLYRLDLESGDRIRLTDSPYEDNDPEVSKDGLKIVFKSTRVTKEEAKEEIFVMNEDGSDVKRLTEVDGWVSDHDPSWAKDGKAIVFERFEGKRKWIDIGNVDILLNDLDSLTPWNNYMVDLEGNLTQLTDVGKGEIAFLPVFNGDDMIYIHMDFLQSDGKVIGAEKKILNQDIESLETFQHLYETKHKYTIEYIDW